MPGVLCFLRQSELELPKRARNSSKIVAAAGISPPPGRKRFGTQRGGRWNFCSFFFEVIFLQFSKIVVVAGSWSPKDGAQDGRFARQGICGFGAFKTRAELELPKHERKCLKIGAAAGIWPALVRK